MIHARMGPVEGAINIPECFGVVFRKDNFGGTLTLSKEGSLFEAGAEHGSKDGRSGAEEVGRELDLAFLQADDEDDIAIWDDLLQGLCSISPCG